MKRTILAKRRGAVAPMFALLLPVLCIMCGFAINLAYVQLVSTELKVACDASAHAGGRAMSIYQSTDQAVFHAKRIGEMNQVGGQLLQLNTGEATMKFGVSVRDNNGYGKYVFTPVLRSSVDAGMQNATSLAVTGHVNLPLVFRVMPGGREFDASRRSIATQVDRDIALVLDRSGSMTRYKDEPQMKSDLYDLYRTYKISWYEYRNASKYSSFSQNVIDELTGDAQQYAHDRRHHGGSAARHSRWYFLELAVSAFLDVLEVTDQEEQVSLVSFSSYATLESELLKDYDPLRLVVEGTYPSGYTAIGKGMQTGLPPIISGSAARPFAAKTIVVLTDGVNNRSPDPLDVVADIVVGNNVTIHTVTFTSGADQEAMKKIALVGGGRHYHADDGDDLIGIFEEIANNLPTILTE